MQIGLVGPPFSVRIRVKVGHVNQKNKKGSREVYTVNVDGLLFVLIVCLSQSRLNGDEQCSCGFWLCHTCLILTAEEYRKAIYIILPTEINVCVHCFGFVLVFVCCLSLFFFTFFILRYDIIYISSIFFFIKFFNNLFYRKSYRPNKENKYYVININLLEISLIKLLSYQCP